MDLPLSVAMRSPYWARSRAPDGFNECPIGQLCVDLGASGISVAAEPLDYVEWHALPSEFGRGPPSGS